MINVQQLRADTIYNQITHNFSLPHIGIHISWENSQSVLILLYIFILAGLSIVFLKYILPRLLLLHEKPVFLEITPPALTDKSAYTTKKLFEIIYEVGSQKTIIDELLGRKTMFSLEIVSTRDQGIRYMVQTTEKVKIVLKRSIMAYLPYAQVKEVPDYIVSSEKKRKNILEFKLKRHYAYPLVKQDVLREHDPVAYITGMMTKLADDELIAFQIVLSPTKHSEVGTISQKILRNEDVLAYLDRFRSPVYLLPITFVVSVIERVGKALLWIIDDFFVTKEERLSQQNLRLMNTLIVTKIKPARTLSSFEQELVQSIHEKVDQLLFEATIRAYISVNNSEDRKQRIRGIRSSLAPFTAQKYQSLQLKYNWFPFVIDKIRQIVFEKRLLSFSSNTSSSLLSVSEIADLYHFPYSEITKTEDVVKVHYKQLPAPLSLKKAKDLDVLFANNTYGGQVTPIGLTQDERRRHMYILGATGTGKSTLLLSMISQDIKNGKGLAVIDPHGELIENILQNIPENRIKDVIYFNPDDIGYPIGLNLLETTQNLLLEDSVREKELITESIISLFHKLYSDKFSGPRMEYILRNTIHTAFTIENATLFTIYKLLVNEDYRRKITSKLTNSDLLDFWKYEFNKAGNFQKVKMISPITNKIGRFLFSATAKRILEQEKSLINFDDIMDSGKILLCNVSKGKIGEDNSEVFGMLILAKLQLAALKRARTQSKKRRDFYLYVDEFQNFATPSFAQILSEARKYKLNAILAHQTTSQLEENNLVNIMLANTGTVICFRTANPEDEKLILPQFMPYVTQGEIASLPSYNFYMKVNAIRPEEPFSGETIDIHVLIDEEKIQKIIDSSRKLYAKKYVEPVQSSEEKTASQSPNIGTNLDENIGAG